MTTPLRRFLRSIPHACWLAFVAVLWLAGDARLAEAQAGLPASCTNFTDSSLSAGTAVKAVHVTQLRSCIADLRSARQLSGPTWTDPTITPGQTVVKAVHLAELRSALNAVYADAGLSAPAYGESISAGVTPIRAGHVMELRAAIVTIPSCSYMIEPGTLFVGAEATTGAVSVATFGGCEWTASGGGFAPLSSGSSFSGSGIATFAISANASSSGRNTTVVVAGRNVVVNQAGVGQSSQNDPSPPTMGEPVDTEVVYFHTDAIGSVRMITDAAGAVLHRYDYSPDGALLNEVNAGAAWNRRTWAGKERDAETTAGATQPLDYFGARYYAQQLGRFTAVDPVLVVEEALADPQRWNRYGYGLRNPLRYVDPDGRYIFHCGALGVEACATAKADFERSREKALNDKDERVRNAAIAYGDPGKDNNVTVTMRSPTEMWGYPGLTLLKRRDGGVFIDVSLSTDATAHEGSLTRTVAHEGEHVRLDQLVQRGHEITVGASERSAYQVGALVKDYRFDRNGRSIRFGPSDTAAIAGFVKSEYPNARERITPK